MKKNMAAIISSAVMLIGFSHNPINTENSYRSNNRGKMYTFQFLLYQYDLKAVFLTSHFIYNKHCIVYRKQLYNHA